MRTEIHDRKGKLFGRESENTQKHKSLRWRERERETNKMQLIWCILSNFYLNMFRASLYPSSGEQECALTHMVFCTVSDGCGCVELGRKLCALWRSLFDIMGIMMPETCWDKSLVINVRLVASCWSLSSPYVHDARSQKPNIYKSLSFSFLL